MNEKCRALPSLRHEIRDLRAVPDKAAAAPIGHIDNDGAAVTSTTGNTDGPPLLRRARVRGVDLARGVAMLGMFAVHVGPDLTSPPVGVSISMADQQCYFSSSQGCL